MILLFDFGGHFDSSHALFDASKNVLPFASHAHNSHVPKTFNFFNAFNIFKMLKALKALKVLKVLIILDTYARE
jgi:hypothetical protein